MRASRRIIGLGVALVVVGGAAAFVCVARAARASYADRASPAAGEEPFDQWMFEERTGMASGPPTVEMAAPDDGPINRLAVVRENDVSVYREPKVYSAVIATVNGGRYVVAEKAKDKLVAVRMADGAVGWVKPECLRILDMPSDPPVGALEDLNLPDFEPRGRKPIYAGGNSIISRAYRYLGIPYVWGGTSDRGLDCSGFVQRVFAEEGIRLPRVAVDQAGVGMAVDRRSLQPGDRVYFQSGHEIDHTGIYIGQERFIHSTSSGGGVIVSDLSAAKWTRIYAGARR